MNPRPLRHRSEILLWVILVGSLLLIWVGLTQRWTLAMPITGLIGLMSWLVKGLYCAVPLMVVGAFVTGRLRSESHRLSVTMSLATAWGAGCVLVVTVGILLLSLGWYTELVWQSVAAVAWLFILGWLVVRRWQPVLEALSSLRSSELGSAPVLSWAGLGLLIGATAVAHAYLPPDTRDEVAYHLVMPKLWAVQADWWTPAENFHLLFPGNTELVWGWATAVSGLTAARFVTLGFAILTVLLLADWLRRRDVPGWIRSVSLIFFVVTPVVLTSASICYVEWPLLFFLFLGWRWSRIGLDIRSPSSLAVAAVCWGMCLGMKYTAALFVGWLALEWLIALARLRPKLAATAALALVIAGVVLAAPWMARNVAVTGDPVYPLGPLMGMNADSNHDPVSVSEYVGLEGMWRWMPWVYHSTVDAVTDHRLHLLWPILLVAVLLMGWRWRRELPWLPVVGSTAALSLFSPSPRIHLPLMLLVWLFLPKLLESLADTRSTRVVTTLALSVAVIVSLPVAWHYMFVAGGPPVPNYLLGVIDTPRYLAQRGLTTPVTRWVDANVSREARLWAWCEDRTLYFKPWTRGDSPYGPPAFLGTVTDGGPQELDRQILDQEIDFIVLRRDRCPEDWSGATFEKRSWTIDSDTRTVLESWRDSRLVEIQRDDRYILFATGR